MKQRDGERETYDKIPVSFILSISLYPNIKNVNRESQLLLRCCEKQPGTHGFHYPPCTALIY